MQRRAPGALRESSSPVPGDQSGRPGDGRLPFGAVRRAMPAVLASVQKRRWRRALPAVTQSTLRVAGKDKTTLFWGSLSQDPLSAALDAPAPGRPLRCAERLSGSGGVARRGCSSAGRVRRPYARVLTQQPPTRAAAPASRLCVAGGRGGSARTTARPASESSDDCWPAQAWWTTTSLGPPNCHTEQWSLPPAHVHGQNRPLSRVSLSVERAFLNSQRARVARHNPPRVIGKPGSLPSLCLLGGRVCVSWKRLRADSA